MSPILTVTAANHKPHFLSFILAPGDLARSLGVAQVGRLNFGKDVSTLKYFTICGLQEGYEPFAVNTNRDITMWLSKRLPQFLQVPSNHEHIEVCFFFKTWTIGQNQEGKFLLRQLLSLTQNDGSNVFHYRGI